MALVLRIVATVVMWILNTLRDRPLALVMLFLSFVKVAVAANDGDAGGRSRPPVFSGERVDYTKWFIAFTIWLALHASECTDLLEGLDDEPPLPQPPVGESAEDEAAADAALALHVAWQKRNASCLGPSALPYPSGSPPPSSRPNAMTVWVR